MARKFAPFLSLVFLLFFSLSVLAGEKFELEEPDYAFLTGSPYTENKNFLQIILTNIFFNFSDAGNLERDFVNTLRLEWGFTNRLEGDLILQFDDFWVRENGVDSNQNSFDDTTLGLRYRFLTEKTDPLTLTFGPQLFLPTGDSRKGMGSGGLGLAWDLTLAKEWTPWFFHYLNLNYSTAFSAVDPSPGSMSNFNLHDFFYSLAIGFRPLEKANSKGGHHDLHVTVEASGEWFQFVEEGTDQGRRQTESVFLIAPGIKYGYLTKNKTLTELGVAGVFGLNKNSPDWGVILQTQFEYGFSRQKN